MRTQKRRAATMSLQTGYSYRVKSIGHGRFLDDRILPGEECEIENIGTYSGLRVATLVFPHLFDSSTKRACREYLALTRDPEQWLEVS